MTIASVADAAPAPSQTRPARRYFGARVILIVLTLPLLWDFFGPIIYLLRIMAFPMIGALYAPVNALSLALIGFAVARGAVVILSSNRPIPKLPVTTMLFALPMLVLGLATAVARGQSFDRPVIAHFYYWTTITISFVLGVGATLTPAIIARIERLIAWFSMALIVSSYLGFFTLELFRRFSGKGFYVGYPSEHLLLPLAHYGRQRRWLMIVLTFGLIVLSGKRGPQIAAVVMLLYIIARGRILVGVIPVLVLALAVMISLPWIRTAVEEEKIDIQSAIGRPIYKWYRMMETASVDPDLASAGRTLEVRETLKLMRTPEDWIFGRGLGWRFRYPDDPVYYHFVHVSYWNYVMTYGLLGSVPFFLLIGYCWLVTWRASLRRNAPPLLGDITLFSLGYLIFVCTANMLSVYIVLWLLMGLGFQIARREAYAR